MEMIALIVSGLALLAAGVCLCLLIQEKKRNQERSAAALDYVDETVNSVKQEAAEYVAKFAEDMVRRIKNLENGVVPDYQQALAAANAVNDFNKGISNILGYDPGEALKAQREKERKGDA